MYTHAALELHLTVAPERSMSKCTSSEGTLASAGSVSSASKQGDEQQAADIALHDMGQQIVGAWQQARACL